MRPAPALSFWKQLVLVTVTVGATMSACAGVKPPAPAGGGDASGGAAGGGVRPPAAPAAPGVTVSAHRGRHVHQSALPAGQLYPGGVHGHCRAPAAGPHR